MGGTIRANLWALWRGFVGWFHLRLAYDTVREMMLAAVDKSDARPGMVAVIQTFGPSLKWTPHIHAIVTRGVFVDDGSWHPIPYVDTHKADLLRSWRHSGFAVHNHTAVYPSDTGGLHKLACYLMCSLVNLSRLRYHPGSQLILYEPKAGHEADSDALTDASSSGVDSKPVETPHFRAGRPPPGRRPSLITHRFRSSLPSTLHRRPRPVRDPPFEEEIPVDLPGRLSYGFLSVHAADLFIGKRSRARSISCV